MEVIISPRRDRTGRRSGFARFANVKDEQMLGITLDNVVLDGKKLYVNLPRLKWTWKEGVMYKERNTRLTGKAAKPLKLKEDKNKWGVVDKRTFKEVMM